nr:hypothetical protein [Candidatus Njordarchaeum guaymaensis]
MEYEEIRKRTRIITEEPVRPISDLAMARRRKEIERKSPKSRSMFEEAEQCIPSGVQHLLV